MNNPTPHKGKRSSLEGKIGIGKRGKKMPKTLTMDEVRKRPLEELFQEVEDTQESVLVIFKEGHEIEIKPTPKLKPMIRLEGSIPEGWKDALYSQE